MLFDQLTKSWAINALTGEPSQEIWGRFLMFTLVYNKGGALGTNFGSSTYYLVSGSLILVFLLWYIYSNRQDYLLSWPFSFIAGGAVGNLIDRIQTGQVVDFIDVDFFDIDFFGFQLQRWWTFNIADAAISCSIVFLVFVMLFFRPPKAG